MSAPARRSRDVDADLDRPRARRGRRSEEERAATKAGRRAGKAKQDNEPQRAYRPSADEPNIPIRKSQRTPETEEPEATTAAPARPEAPAPRPRRSRDRRGARPGAGARADAPDRAGRPGRLGRARAFAAERVRARRGRIGAKSDDAGAQQAGAGRASFVVAIIALLVVGVVATLWLSTQAIADSYRLEAAKEEAARLAEQKAVLQREVSGMESAPALAKRARELGMIPAGDPAWLRVGPDGKVTVVGDPTKVVPPPPPETKKPDPKPPAGGTPAGNAPAGDAPAGEADGDG
jgi:hypothetical protein